MARRSRAALLAAATIACSAQAPWTKKDVALEVAFQAVLFIDWKQTSEFHRSTLPNSGPVEEANKILGKFPKQSNINLYFACASLIHIGVAHWMPRDKRNGFQGISIAIEGLCVNDNRAVGIRIKW